MESEQRWNPPTVNPEPNRKLDWMDSQGNITTGGTKSGRMWFLPDGMYIYYTPTFWRYSDAKGGK